MKYSSQKIEMMDVVLQINEIASKIANEIWIKDCHDIADYIVFR